MMTTKHIKPAKGLKGCILRSLFEPGDCYFRVYDQDGNFDDYKIAHFDLDVVIDDVDAHTYEYLDGNKYIDYGPDTLGIKIE